MFSSKDTLFGKKDEIAARDGKLPGASLRGSAVPSLAHRPESQAPSSAASANTDSSPLAPAPAASSGSKLIVGPDIKLKGVEITDCDTLVVEGRVEASMDSRVIQIAERGVYSGTVGIDVAEISGRFEGELTARKHLLIHATGRVSGTIRYGKITVEDGGEISGTISTLSAAMPSASETGNSMQPGTITPYDSLAHKSKPGTKSAGAPY